MKAEYRSVIVLTLVHAQILRTCGQTWLLADMATDTYTLINSVLGGTAVEVPDCKHKVKHIEQGNDEDLKRPVFLFHAHVNKDDDRCITSTSQRTEIKTYGPSPKALKGFQHETVYLSWTFKIDAGFQPSKAFTSFHQLKARGGDDRIPPIALVARAGNPDVLQIVHVSSNGTRAYIGSTPLAPFRGNWVHVREEAKYSHKGHYSITISTLSDGKTLFTLRKSNFDMWRKGADYIRPKWGIYRGLTQKEKLRDETVRYGSFCLGKGSEKCN